VILESAKTLNFKVSLFFVTVSVGLVIVLTAVTFLAFRQFSINAVTEHLHTAAEVVRLHLTESMVNGTIDQRQNFLFRLAEVRNLRTARVIRSPILEKQFGDTHKGEYLPDETEKNVMKSGKPVFRVDYSGSDVVLRGTIPYTVTQESNCVKCHNARPGEVLAVVTMTMPFTSLRQNAIVTAVGIIGIVIVALALLFISLYRLLKPISNTASDIERAVREAIGGNFRSEIKKQTNDEIGQIANDMNRLLKFLGDGLDKMNSYILQLVDRQQNKHENQLLATIEMVKNITQISQYKIAIEEDNTKLSVYRRLINTLNTRFFNGHGEFSVFEVSGDNNELLPISLIENMNASCRWCQQKILMSPKSCRVFHTAHMINGLIQPDLCYSFKQNGNATDSQDVDENGGRERHYPLCFPILKSGIVGSIVQMIVKETDKERILVALPYIRVYMAETAPVLEVRRLMETLRESSLRDPMTGLNNRRFLEEYIDTLIAGTHRNQTHVAILMLDLDNFKMINDTYGHDAGDLVLKTLASIIRSTVRASDFVIRYGGEEFMVVLQDTTCAPALKVAEKIRTSVEATKINHGEATLQRTLSIGISDFPGDSSAFWQAVKFADVALYNAKQAGRNRVVRFTHDMWQDACSRTSKTSDEG